MSNVTNLNRFRKQKARADKRREGDAKAAQHGLSKTDKDIAILRRKKADRDLDGKKQD